jgi:hypothetical protein
LRKQPETLAVPDDLGLAINHTETYLRTLPAWRGEVLHQIKAATKLRIHKFDKTWAQVSDFSNPEIKGWAEISALFLKADLASLASINHGAWQAVKLRQGSELILGGGKSARLDQVTGLMTRADQAFVLKTKNEINLNSRALVSIEAFESTQWLVSRLSEHGEVYWRKGRDNQQWLKSQPDQKTHYLDILKKPIFSVAFHPKNSRLGVISAEGIYMTEDGISWRRLPQFNKENWPVAISPDFEIFVGDQRSTDLGQTFLPYIRWDQVTRLVEGRSKVTSKILRLARLEPKSGKRISVEIDNGSRLWRLTGSTKFGLVSQWTAEDSGTRDSSRAANITE